MFPTTCRSFKTSKGACEKCAICFLFRFILFYFFFKCGDRFTAHQHLDNGHFLIYKHEELAGDGGQHHDWPHHNGSVEDSLAWERDRELYDITDMLAVEDQGSYLYLAGDCSRAYKSITLKQVG